MAKNESCGCHPLLTLDEMAGVMAALFDEPDRGQSAAERQEMRRVTLKLAADFLRAGQSMPDLLSDWLANNLLALHDALEGVQEASIGAALAGLGRRPKGNPGRGIRSDAEQAERDPGVAAAVAILAMKVGVAKAAQAIATATGLSVSSVYRAREEVSIDPDDETSPGLAAPVIERVRASVHRESHQHSAEILDLMRVTPVR